MDYFLLFLLKNNAMVIYKTYALKKSHTSDPNHLIFSQFSNSEDGFRKGFLLPRKIFI